MINLLPPEYVNRLRYGRRNASLQRWLIASLLASVFLGVLIGIGSLYIDRQVKNLQHSADGSTQQLQAQNLSKVQAQAKEVSDNVKIINQVLKREIRFSALIQEVGKVMPPGTILNSLTLNKLSGAIDLSTSARDELSAARIAVNLSDPANKLFDKVDIVTINCNSGDSTYKCTATFKALFSGSVPNRFLNVPEKK